jgi:hypothetical protein
MIRLNRILFRDAPAGILAVVLLAGCGELAMNEILFPHNVSRHVVFNEAEFARSRGSGSGAVRGHAFLANFSDGAEFPVANTKIELFPVTSYTTETIQRKYANGVYLAPADPRYAKYVRVSRTDGNGNFRFENLPAGRYYVGAKFSVTSMESVGDDGDTQPELHYRRLYADVAVQSGRTATVANWSGGPERIRD